MNYTFLSIMIIFVTCSLSVLIIVYVIFDNNDDNGNNYRINNEFTIIVGIMVGMSITIIIQCKQSHAKELKRKPYFNSLWTNGIWMMANITVLLEEWKNPLSFMDSKERNKEILLKVSQSKKDYNIFLRQLNTHYDLLDSNYFTWLNQGRGINRCFKDIKKDSYNKNHILELQIYYDNCLNLIPEKYRDYEEQETRLITARGLNTVLIMDE